MIVRNSQVKEVKWSVQAGSVVDLLLISLSEIPRHDVNPLVGQ